MADLQQEPRTLEVKTPLGANVLVLVGFEGSEALSHPFSYRLEMIADASRTIAPTDLLGKKLTVTVGRGGEQRVFHGVVKQFAAGGFLTQKQRIYYAELVPWFWLLTRAADCRIFQNKTVPEIIDQVFSDHGFTDYESQLTATYPTREYCVQYRETTFAFLSRLMEEVGIAYYFKHADGQHKMVLIDAKTAFYDAPNGDVECRGDTDRKRTISNWTPRFEFRSGKWAQTDYNFETPNTSLLTNTNTVLGVSAFNSYELFDYPGLYTLKADGTTLTKTRMEEEEASYHEIAAAGNCTDFSPGAKFKTATHEIEAEVGKKFVVLSVNHSASDRSQLAGGGEATYTNRFTCIPDTVSWRPPRVTPKPVVRGPQTAVVVGPSGEEIYVDKYGRIKVQFHWDRVGTKDENSSCWMRVGQLLAGAQWGGIFTPRIGMEVIVDFLEGDPDRPLVVGTVYNASNMPPYALPANKTQSGLKTRSSTQGGSDDFNELRFEDKKGSEEVYFHAQKDFNRVVENNDTLKVGSSNADDGSQTINIYKDRTTTIETGNEKLTVEQGARTVTVSQGNDTHDVTQGNRTVTVGQGNDTHQVKMGNRDVQIDMGNDALTIKMGNQTTKLNLGASSTEAMQSIELKVGQSSVKIDQMGVTIKGMMVTIEGQLQTQVKGLMTQVNGDAMLQVKGGITMIN